MRPTVRPPIGAYWPAIDRSTGDAVLTIRDLRRTGLGPVDLDLADGECIAVTGPSGAGKSLFLRAVADLDPNEGNVALDGIRREDMPAPAWRRRVVYVAAEPGWWADLVGEHFADWDRAAPIVAAAGLPEEARDWPVARLSTGERQRLGLARALVLDPRVLLLDEPTAALDEKARDAVERLLLQRLAAGVSILLASHDSAQLRRLARRRLAFEGGVAREMPA